MSLAQGFMQGWGLMDNHYDKKHNRERQAEQDKLGLDRHNQSMANMTQQNQLNQLKIDDYSADKAQQRKVQDAQLKASEASLNNSTYSLDQKKKDDQFKRALSAFNAMASTGDFSGFFDNEDIMATDFKLLASKEGRDAAMRIAERFDTGDLTGVAQDMNILFKPNLNRMVGKAKGRDGGEIRDINIVGVDPVEGGKFKFRVDVTTDKGKYQSYISEMRSGDPNDPEKKYDPEQVLGKVGGLAEVSKLMQTSGMNERIASQGQDYINRMGLNPQAKGGAANRVPAKIQEHEYIKSIFGKEGLQQVLFASKSKDPMVIRETALKMANDMVNKDANSMNLPSEQKLQAVNNIARSLMSTMQNGFDADPQGDGGQVDAQRQAFLNKLSQMSQQVGNVQ